jgi:Cu/Ag efflux protein CusF
MNKKALGIVAGALLAIAPLVALAVNLPAPFEGSSMLQADGIVKSVDQSRHQVTVVDPNGSEASFNISDATNLAQIRQGAKVHIRMVRNAMVSVTRGANAQGGAATASTIVPAADSGAAASAALPQNVTAEIQSVDHANGIMALKGARGIFHIKSRNSASLAGVKEGMQVTIAFAPQVIVAVAPAQ